MIIPKRLISAAESILGSADYPEATLVVQCNKLGDFVGKVFVDRKLKFITNPRKTFKFALLEILEICDENYLEEIE